MTPKAPRGEWGGGFPFRSQLGGLGERCELPSGVRGKALAENEFGAFYRCQEATGSNNDFPDFKKNIFTLECAKNLFNKQQVHSKR